MAGLTPWLLLGVLLLPTLGAVLARVVGRWTSVRAAQLIGGAGVIGAIVCVGLLRFLPADTATFGRLQMFLPSNEITIAQNSYVVLPTAAPESLRTPAAATPTVRPSATTTIQPTATTVPTATVEPPTATPPPTEAPPPAETAPPPEPTRAPAPQPQRYVVERGDTLRGIAERFDVSVDALLRYNGLTPEEGDALSLGQELLIPPQ